MIAIPAWVLATLVLAAIVAGFLLGLAARQPRQLPDLRPAAPAPDLWDWDLLTDERPSEITGPFTITDLPGSGSSAGRGAEASGLATMPAVHAGAGELHHDGPPTVERMERVGTLAEEEQAARDLIHWQEFDAWDAEMRRMITEAYESIGSPLPDLPAYDDAGRLT